MYFPLGVDFCTKRKNFGDACDRYGNIKGTIRGHGGRRPMNPKNLKCSDGAVRRIMESSNVLVERPRMRNFSSSVFLCRVQ